MKSRMGIFFGVSAIALCAPVAAQQSTPTPPATDTAAATNDGFDIVVTAQKRAERLQDVPIAIAAVSGAQLAKAGTTLTVQNIQVSVPGLQYNAIAGNTQPFLRGIGSDGTQPNIDSSVATYIDGVYVSFNKGINVDLVGIDHVEVVKGPQGTLFGRNAVGGAISIITRTPGQNFVANMAAGYGNFNAKQVNGYIEGGLAEGLSLGVYGAVSERNSYYHFITTTPQAAAITPDHVSHELGRIKLAYESGNLKLVGSYEYAHSKDPEASAFRQTQANALGYALGGTPVDQRYTQSTDYGSIAEVTTHALTLRGDLDLGFANLVSITGYRNLKDIGASDFDATDAPVVSFKADPDYSRQFSQEVQLLSPTGSRINWIVGAYYFHENSGFDPLRFYFPIVSPVPNVIDDVNVLTKSVAVFGQLTYPITDRPKLTVGGRYTSDKKTFTGSESYQGLTGNTLAPTIFFAPPRASWHKFTPKASLDYKVNDTLFYATYSKGYKAGGYSISAPNTPGPVNPENLTAYEVGIKTDFLDRRVQLNTAAYYYDYRDLQTSTISGTTGGALFQNAGKARIWGIESDLSARLSDTLNAHLAGSYINSKYQNFPNFAGYTIQAGGNVPTAINVDGNPVQRAPKFTFSGGLDYHYDLSNGSRIDWSGDVYYNDGFSWDPTNRLREPSYTLVNSSVSFTLPGGHLKGTLWTRNLFDKKYEDYQVVSAFGVPVIDAIPRTYGVTLSYTY